MAFEGVPAFAALVRDLQVTELLRPVMVGTW